MLTIRPEKIYISSANVDMRKSIDGLSAIVEQNFKLNQFSNAIINAKLKMHKIANSKCTIMAHHS